MRAFDDGTMEVVVDGEVGRRPIDHVRTDVGFGPPVCEPVLAANEQAVHTIDGKTYIFKTSN